MESVSGNFPVIFTGLVYANTGYSEFEQPIRVLKKCYLRFGIC